MSTINQFDPTQQNLKTSNIEALNTTHDYSDREQVGINIASDTRDENSDLDNATSELVFTDNAANKVKELLDEEGDPNLKLRAFISGGGCSGFQYGFTFDEQQNDDDFVLKKNGVMLLIDVMSMQYLSGAEIDYKEDESGEQFVIRNPNAQTTCGCGSSFSV
jgi:iron-sulfur cluster insertion protein